MSDRDLRQTPSRADQLRQKRQQSSRQPVIPARQPVSRPAPRPTQRAAVVTTRTYPYSTPLRQSVVVNPRRKVIYKVAANGVETRFPALPIIHFNWQWVSGGLAVLFLVLSLLLTNMSTFEVTSVDVEGIQRLTTPDIYTVVKSATGSIFTINRTKTVAAITTAFPELTDVHLRISLPSTVKLTVRERQPIMAWSSGDQVVWVDADGVVMPPRGDAGALLTVQASGTLPLTKTVVDPTNAIDYAMMVINLKTEAATPESEINTIDPSTLRAAIDMSAQMPEGASLVFDSVSGMGWQDPRGWKVYFGTDLENIQFKNLEYQAIVDRLGQMGIVPSTISVEHIDAPYYRTE
jgi:cell division protein FtsQ